MVDERAVMSKFQRVWGGKRCIKWQDMFVELRGNSAFVAAVKPTAFQRWLAAVVSKNDCLSFENYVKVRIGDHRRFFKVDEPTPRGT